MHSHIDGRRGGHYALFNLTFLSCFEPAFNLGDTLFIGPVFKLALRQVKDFPPLQLENFWGQLLHLWRLFVRLAESLKMELYADLLLHKDIVQSEQVVHRHKRHRIHIAVACQEGAEVLVLPVWLIVVIQLHHVEVFFSIEELVLVVRQQGAVVSAVPIPLREVMRQKMHARLERFVIQQWHHSGLFNRGFHNLAPN